MMLRVMYAKKKQLRYISHLEVMYTLRRAFRRAEMPVSYSKGYNPKINISMGQPLRVGMVGKGEYFDLELEKEIDPNEFIKRVNNKLPSGIRLKEGRYVPQKVKSLQAILNTAIYDFKMVFSGPVEEKKVKDEFLSQNEIKVTRHRRNKDDRILDLKPLVYEVEIKEPALWSFTVSTGSQGNVRPGELIRALGNCCDNIEKVPPVNIERAGLYVQKEGKLYKAFASEIVGS